MYCPYHDADHPAGTDFSDEHIVPYSVGGSNQFTIQICKEANDKFGTHVDSKMVESTWIKLERIKYNLTGHSGKLPEFTFDGFSNIRGEKTAAKYTFSKDQKKLFIAPKVEQKTEAERDVIHIECTEDQLQNIIKGKNKNLAKTGAGQIDSKELYENMKITAHESIEIIATEEIDLYLFERSFAKIALATAYYALGEGYSRSADAKLIRQFMNEDDSEKRQEMRIKGQIWPYLAEEDRKNDEALTRLYKYSEQHHVIALTNFGSLAFYILLFGKYSGTIVLAEDPTPYARVIPPRQGLVYVINSVDRTFSRLSHTEYLMRVAGLDARLG